MRQCKGLTLVETVVVIAVGVFSVSVMIPGLDQRRQAARKTVCMANIRALTAGVYAYAQVNDNYIPSTEYGANPVWNHMLYIYFPNHPITPTPMDGWRMYGLGHLHADGLVQQGEVFYCPSQEHPSLNPDLYFPAQMFPGIEGLLPKNFISGQQSAAMGSFMYGLIGQADFLDPEDQAALVMTDLKLPYAKQRVLVSDMFIPIQNAGVYQSTWVHGSGLNVGFVDGHVDFVQVDQQIIDLANEQRAYDNDRILLHRADLFIASMFELLAGDSSYMQKYFGPL